MSAIPGVNRLLPQEDTLPSRSTSNLHSTQHDTAPPETTRGLARSSSITSIPPSYDQVLREVTVITDESSVSFSPPNEIIILEGNSDPEPPPYSTKEAIGEQLPGILRTARPSMPSVPLARDSEDLLVPAPSTSDALVTRAVQPLQSQPPPRSNAIVQNNFQPPLRPYTSPNVICFNGRSQYTTGASSSCIPSSMEACLQVVYLRPLSLETLEHILKAGSCYRGSSHIEARTLQANVKRYSEALETIGELHYSLTDLRQLVNDLLKLAKAQGKPVAAIITKPPESIMIAVHNEPGRDIVMFDSHPRPELHPDGAAFLVFKEPNGLLAYLRHLMPTSGDLNLRDLDMYQAMVLGSVSVLMFTASKNQFNTNLAGQDLFMLEIQYENFDLRQENMSLIERLESVTRDAHNEVASLNETIRMLNEELRINDRSSSGRRDTWNNNHQSSSTAGKGSSASKGLRNPFWSRQNGAISAGNERPLPKQPQQLAVAGPSTLGQSVSLYKEPQDSTITNEGKNFEKMNDDLELARRLQEEEQGRNMEDDQDAAMARRLQEEFAMEDSRLNADRSQAELYDQRILECPICGDQYPLDDTFHLEDCNHEICRTCAATYIQIAVRERTFPCLCPCCKAANEQTPREIPQHMALSVLSVEDQVIWLSVERERGITSDSAVRFIYCRNKECEKPFEVGTVMEADRLSRITCPYCRHQWCEKCDIDTWHEGATCKQYQKWKEDNGNADELTDAVVKEAGYKKCPGPNCGQIIEKTIACNHMKCTQCNTHFCYLCGAFITQCAVKNDIDRAVKSHYTTCTLFDVPAE